MDALMAALFAAALVQVGDRTAWLTAILVDRFRRPGHVLVAAALAVAGASGIAATGGALVAPLLTPNARALLLALALALQGGGALFAAKPPDRLDGWRLGAFATAGVGLFVLAFGDGAQFIVAALAARGGSPWGAAIGATIGSLAVLVPAGLVGERAWTAAPLPAVRRAIGIVFIMTGLVLGLGALRLT
jgi:putative Ca2+/H+ antiporter (TMEM165/GDT1 family)